MFLPIPITSAHAKNKLSRSKGKGCRRGTNKQTNKQTNIPRTEQRLKTYEIIFQFLFLFVHRRSNKKLARVKTMKKLKPLNLDTQKLLLSMSTFQINLRNRFEAIKEIDAATFCDIMSKEAKEIAGGKDTPTKIESEEDIEIRKMDEKRKRLRNKESKSTTEKIEYAELKKTVKKKKEVKSTS